MARRLRIFHLGELPPYPGGAGIRDYQLLQGLSDRGHEVAALAVLSDDLASEVDAWSDPRIRFFRIVIDQTCEALLEDTAQSWARIWRRVHELLPAALDLCRPDVVLVGKETFGWGVPDVARRRGLPCVMLSQSMSFDRWRRDFPEPVTSKLMDDLRAANLVICCARHLLEARLAQGVTSVAMVPNAVDGTRLRPLPPDAALRRELCVDDRATIAVHLSNLKPVKRVLDLVAAAARAPLEASVIHVVVGTGPTRGAVEAACREFGVADRFRFVGWVDPRRAVDHLNLADIVLMPSQSEGMPLVCLEAMACAKLVIGSDIAGIREIITDGETGLLFPMGDVEDLTSKILLAAHDPKLRARIGSSARAQVERHHRLDDMVGRYESLLISLVGA